MARTPDDIVKSIIGEQVVQIAVLTSKNEELQETIGRLKKEIEGASIRLSDMDKMGKEP